MPTPPPFAVRWSLTAPSIDDPSYPKPRDLLLRCFLTFLSAFLGHFFPCVSFSRDSHHPPSRPSGAISPRLVGCCVSMKPSASLLAGSFRMDPTKLPTISTPPSPTVRPHVHIPLPIPGFGFVKPPCVMVLSLFPRTAPRFHSNGHSSTQLIPSLTVSHASFFFRGNKGLGNKGREDSPVTPPGGCRDFSEDPFICRSMCPWSRKIPLFTPLLKSPYILSLLVFDEVLKVSRKPLPSLSLGTCLRLLPVCGQLPLFRRGDATHNTPRLPKQSASSPPQLSSKA